jgi:hypothetical protein
MLLLTGDIHGELSRIMDIDDFGMTKDDVLLVCGDFGFIWSNEEVAKNYLRQISTKNFQIAFIDGNHENFPLIAKMEIIKEWNGGRAGVLPYGIIHLLRSEVYCIENKKIGVCGGADSIDRSKRVNGISWWEEEMITPEQTNKLVHNVYENYNGHLDIMLTHDCPTEALQLLGVFYPSIFEWIVQENTSRRELDKIEAAIPAIDRWFFGHHHIDKYLGSKYRALYTDVVQL